MGKKYSFFIICNSFVASVLIIFRLWIFNISTNSQKPTANSHKKKRMTFFKKAINLYIEGFRNITKLGVKLWMIILIKLFIMFAILRLFFFPDFLNSNFETEKEKGDYVIKVLTEK